MASTIHHYTNDDAVVDWPLGSQRIQISLVVLRLCTYILDELLSCYSVFPFVSPVPAAAVLYHAKIQHPMDFSTLEHNLYNNKYKTLEDFEQDLSLIWRNAKAFHEPVAFIYKLAVHLEERYVAILARIKGLEGATMPSPDPTVVSIPEETDFSTPLFNEVQYSTESVLYFLQLVLPDEKGSKAIRGFSKVRALYDELNAPFIRVVEGLKTAGGGDGTTMGRPLPRLYIGKNRTLLTEARRTPHATVAVLMNVRVTPYRHSKRSDLFHMTADVAIVRPLGECREFDAAGVDPSLTADYLPKACIKVCVVKVVSGIQAVITAAMEKLFFRRAYTTHRLSRYYLPDLKKVRDTEIAKMFTQAIIDGHTSLLPEDAYYTSSAAAVSVANSNASSPSAKRPSSPANSSSPGSIHTPSSSNKPSKETFSPSPDTTTAEQLVPSSSSTIHATTIDRIPDKQKDGIAYTKYLAPDDEATNQSQVGGDARRHYYLEQAKELWSKVFEFCSQKNVPVVHVNKYLSNTSTFPNAEGFFKHVYHVHNDSNVVVQTFRRMTITQRATELVSLLMVHGHDNMGQIVEVLQEDGGEIIGLAMRRYQKTLKQYAHKHSHHRLTAHQKMDVIRQMLRCIATIHSLGIAHRDLAEVNFMVDETAEKLPDDSPRSHVYLIDFGKAIFVRPEDLSRWWVDRPRVQGEYEGEVLPESRQELEEWCKELPWVRSKPDHGYRHYRSIQTLPRARTDNDTLPYLVNPLAEDVYSLGTLVWKTLGDTEPWCGILDTDLRGLREAVMTDHAIDNILAREVPGPLSRQLLRFFLRTQPQERKSAAAILEWLEQPGIQERLISEWTEFASLSRTKRHRPKLLEDVDSTSQHRPNRKKQRITTTPPSKTTPESSSSVNNNNNHVETTTATASMGDGNSSSTTNSSSAANTFIFPGNLVFPSE
ncbi:hypothetical protein RO3G_03479 [Lichtheimia corymbifera JMRC:FSU:9682]|uniref:Protein kinase domain-containing protein n=1 Tax=Lichtheimia corymbifera JMRC:FSU:9682 TaxID=1263082 RepID=A0A068RXM0_9FUNG|nr:hypothetical protein RO3G_03479 [Lichtheimia corymbifera JMRC:FSU:9682]